MRKQQDHVITLNDDELLLACYAIDDAVRWLALMNCAFMQPNQVLKGSSSHALKENNRLIRDYKRLSMKFENAPDEQEE